MNDVEQLYVKLADSDYLPPRMQQALAAWGLANGVEELPCALLRRPDLDPEVDKLLAGSLSAAVAAAWLARPERTPETIRRWVVGERRVTVLAAIASREDLSQVVYRTLADLSNPSLALVLVKNPSVDFEIREAATRTLVSAAEDSSKRADTLTLSVVKEDPRLRETAMLAARMLPTFPYLLPGVSAHDFPLSPAVREHLTERLESALRSSHKDLASVGLRYLRLYAHFLVDERSSALRLAAAARDNPVLREPLNRWRLYDALAALDALPEDDPLQTLADRVGTAPASELAEMVVPFKDSSVPPSLKKRFMAQLAANPNLTAEVVYGLDLPLRLRLHVLDNPEAEFALLASNPSMPSQKGVADLSTRLGLSLVETWSRLLLERARLFPEAELPLPQTLDLPELVPQAPLRSLFVDRVPDWAAVAAGEYLDREIVSHGLWEEWQTMVPHLNSSLTLSAAVRAVGAYGKPALRSAASQPDFKPTS